jgi:hypothetical protein
VVVLDAATERTSVSIEADESLSTLKALDRMRSSLGIASTLPELKDVGAPLLESTDF